MLQDPDGHEVRFYTVEHHTALDDHTVTTVHDPRETSEERERDYARRGDVMTTTRACGPSGSWWRVRWLTLLPDSADRPVPLGGTGVTTPITWGRLAECFRR
jgi:hypothetical protein